MKRTSTRMASIAIMCLATSSALADTLHVPGQYPTIQAGINAAQNGDTVLVADGTYTGPGNRDLDFGGKLITVRSEKGPENCIIDCEGAGQGFYFHNGETVDAVVDGFTVRNGSSSFGGGIACYSGSGPTVNNCTFENGLATRGAGMYNNGSSPIVRNCVFRNNSGTFSVGMQNYSGSHPTVENCVFIGNTATSWTGGLGNWANCSPTVTNCLFMDNSAYGGGGMNNWSGCDPIVTNCLFVGNSATYGGGIYNRFTSDNPVVTNCTFVDNTASYGRAIYDGQPTVSNCILWNGGTSEISGSVTITYSDVQGGASGDGNIDADPLFIDPIGGDYHLTAGSPCINAGSNYAPGISAEDLDGDPRIQNCRVDMGAYESPDPPAILNDCNGNGVLDDCDVYDATSGDCNLNHVPDECDPGGLEDCNGNGIPDLCDIYEGTSLDCNANGIPDECESGSTYYVDDNGPGDPGPGDPSLSDPSEDGSLEHPFDAIQEAIDASSCLSGNVVVVADGEYAGVGNRDLDYGGKLLSVRSENGPENCIIDCEGAGRGFYFHSGETADAVVEGFTVRNAYYSGFGAGIACEYGSSPTINNCIFENGSATRGAGMYNSASSPVVTNCVFRNNSGTFSAGMQNYSGSHPTVVNCIFIGNTATSWIGGLSNWVNCSPTVTNCLFIQNSGRSGALGNWSGCDPVVTNCLFVGNSATYGGGIYNRFTSDNPTITNCTFVDNSASYGHGVYGGLPYINNCILWNGGTGEIVGDAVVTHSDVQGGWPDPGAVVESGGPLVEPGYLYTWEIEVDAGLYYDFHIYDSYGDGIFSPGGYAVYYEETLVYSCIGEGWDGFSETVESIGVGGATIRVEILTDTWPGETTWNITGPGTNIDADPQFVDAVNGDFHITHESPCMDAGDNAAVYVATDLDANPRIVGLAVDMGAYEVQDTDGDGLLNQTELDIAEGSGCPDPYDADSDDDTLSDLEEVIAGTNPCNADTDGDGLGDAIDPTPLIPGATTGWLEDACRALADEILQLDLGLFNGPNSNANAGRRNSLANRATDAANAIAIADNEGAVESLTSLLHKVDDQSPPPDWMDPSPEKTALADDVNLLIALILLLP